MNKKRLYSLDFLRIIATVLIVFHHYQQTTGAFFEGKINFFAGKFYFEYIVEFFFLLSGFFVHDNVEKIQFGELSFKPYITRRLMRLLPLVFVSGVAYEAFLYYYTEVIRKSWFDISVNIWGVVINALGMQDGWVFSNPCVNNPTWYISVLILCYLVFFFVTYAAKRLSISPYYFYFGLVLIGCGINTYGINLPFFNLSSSRGYYAFFFGVILAQYISTINLSNKNCAIDHCVHPTHISLVAKA